MAICTSCRALLPSSLETYGDLNAPMCLSCHLNLCGEGVEPALFYYEDQGEGWLLKRLTDAGAVFLEGAPDQAVLRVHRGQGLIEVLS